MKVLIIKNVVNEGPGTIEDFLKEKNIDYKIAEFSKDEIVNTSDGYTHLVIMGGPMAVYEMDKYPYLIKEAILIEDFIKKQKSVLGICLGAQMIAHVLGARVYPAGIKEIGWYLLEITPEGMQDETIRSLSINGHQTEVFQWHGDTFDIPVNGVRVVTSKQCKNQAFRYHNNVYALQFHIEVNPDMIKEWFEEEKEYNLQEMLKHTESIYAEYYSRALKFYEKFFLDKNM